MKGIIIKPIITEKATMQSEKFNRFTFSVDRKANKLEIKKAELALKQQELVLEREQERAVKIGT